MEATKRLNFRLSALLKDSFKSIYTLCCTDNEDAVLVTGEYEDPRTLLVLAMPISDNKLLIAASVYARQVSLLSCRINKRFKYH